MDTQAIRQGFRPRLTTESDLTIVPDISKPGMDGIETGRQQAGHSDSGSPFTIRSGQDRVLIKLVKPPVLG